MKQYTKPTATVVELSVKENIAGLPAALGGEAYTSNITVGEKSVLLTTYNLAAASTSEIA